MKAETQADSLASLVETKRPYPEYELVFPFFKVKQSAVKKLALDDVLLVGSSQLELSLLFEGRICANVLAYSGENYNEIEILYLEKDTTKQKRTKKYEILKCSLGMIRIRKLEPGQKASLSELDLHKIELFVNDKNIATGRLVTVDDEIAIQIIELTK